MTNPFTPKKTRRPLSAPALHWVILTVALIGAGCGRVLDEEPVPPGTVESVDDLPIDPDAPYPPAIAAAIGRLAEELGVTPQSIQVVSYEEAEWPDGCLGLPRPDEACTEAVTPGWRVILSVDGQLHTFRADALGIELREE